MTWMESTWKFLDHSAVGSIASLLTVGVAAWTTRLAANASARNNAATDTMAEIERSRRTAELCPRLRITLGPQGTGSGLMKLRVALLGPPGLSHLDSLLVTVRNDHFRRGENHSLPYGPSPEDVKRHVWGPLRFRPGVGPDTARADEDGRHVAYNDELPVGEELPYLLERTNPAPWMEGATQQVWHNQCGTVLRLSVFAVNLEHGKWTLPCEIDFGDGTREVQMFLP